MLCAASLWFAWIASDCSPAPAPSAAPAPTWTIPSSDAIRALLAGRLRAPGVGIVIGVIEPAGRRVVAHGESGAADGRPLDGDTIFMIGSVTKVFTGLLLADMVQRGEAKLDDPAASYLPTGVRMPERGRPITLLDLATHRSGLPAMPDNFSLQGEPDPYAGYSVEQLHQFLSSYVLPREPGAKSEYSNLGVALLGRLLARRAGMDYEALLKARVLAPLGLNSTTITLTPDQALRLAPGHDRYLKPVDTWNLVTLPASGALRSTANDLLAFLAANLGAERTPLELAMVFQRTVRHPAAASQALAWGVNKQGVVRHEGGKEGYRSAVAFWPETRSGVVVLVNARTDEKVMAIAMHLLTGSALPPAPAPPPPLPTMVTLDRKILDTYAGRYRLPAGGALQVARRGDHLLVKEGSGMAPFFASGPLSFFSTDERLTFEVDAAGRPVRMVLHEDGADRPATRMDED